MGVGGQMVKFFIISFTSSWKNFYSSLHQLQESSLLGSDHTIEMGMHRNELLYRHTAMAEWRLSQNRQTAV